MKEDVGKYLSCIMSERTDRSYRCVIAAADAMAKLPLPTYLIFGLLFFTATVIRVLQVPLLWEHRWLLQLFREAPP